MLAYDVVIVGAGHGGAQAAIALRQLGFDGTIAIVGEEPDLPYERPPLSKEYFSGEKAFERILIRPVAFWNERAIEMRTGMRVTHVHADRHEVQCDDGQRIGYGRLIWATGGKPRRLPGAERNAVGLHHIRTRADVDRLVAELETTRQVVVIGGGYIGLEAAAVLAGSGKSVVLLETRDRVLSRVAGPAISRFFEAEHRRQGVDIHLNAAIAGVEMRDGRVIGIRLATGDVIAAQMVVVGIGIIPAVDPLLAAGADGGDGVAVDPQCRSTLPDVFAIGDCAAHANDFADRAVIRLESVQNANDQAMVAARTIMGIDTRYDVVPWFWSIQYDIRLQTVGLSSGHDRSVVRGDPATRSFSVIYLRQGRVIALDCVNSVRDYVQGRSLVLARFEADAALLARTDVALKDMILTPRPLSS